MDDLELIKLAGRAAGCEYTQDSNPLQDDALALRLAVQLEMQVMVLHDTSQPKPWLRVETRAGDWIHAGIDEFEKDPYAATRRAIVRAAAEIGRIEP